MTDVGIDIRFWSKASEEAGSVMDKMIAIACIQQDYQLLALAALKRPSIPKMHIVEQNALLEPLPASVFDMQGAMWGEHLSSFHGLHLKNFEGYEVETGIKAFFWKIPLWFYQEHTTQNGLYQRVLKTRPILKMSPSKLAQLKASDVIDLDCGKVAWSLLKNPVGKFFLCIGQADVSPLVLTLHRLETMRRLVVIQTQLLQHEPSEYAQIIQNLPADLRNPQNGKPPRLDLKAHRLEFDWATRDGESKPLRVDLP